jgi:cytochrome c peroxidase
MSRFVLALTLVACSGTPAPSDGAGAAGASGSAGAAMGGSADDDPEPMLDRETLASLRALSPDELPAPPADASNAWADDADAASFGQALFFDTRFSGALLDGDNDGSPNALGTKGETGKVSCAGCHLPEAGFSDERTIRHQTSLGSGWGLRRAPSLLDVGHSSLLMWDGRRTRADRRLG